jgi:hypothetical protein
MYWSKRYFLRKSIAFLPVTLRKIDARPLKSIVSAYCNQVL